MSTNVKTMHQVKKYMTILGCAGPGLDTSVYFWWTANKFKSENAEIHCECFLSW